MRRYTYISVFILAILSFAFSTFAEASPSRKFKSEYRKAVKYEKVAQKRISASQAKSIARKKIRDAEVLAVIPERDRYIVRMQKKNGRIVDVSVDATTGRVK